MEYFFHACRLNPNITDIVMNNQVYGLTKGQLSPTGHKKLVTPTRPEGAKDEPVEPVFIAIISGATYVACGYSYNQKQLVELIRQGIPHRSFALVNVLSPCPTYHEEPDYDSVKDYYEENILDVIKASSDMRAQAVQVEEILVGYDPSNKMLALRVVEFIRSMPFCKERNCGWQGAYPPWNGDDKSFKDHMKELAEISSCPQCGSDNIWIGKIPIGLIYRAEGRSTYEDNLGLDEEHPVVERDISVETNRRRYQEFMDLFR